MTGGVAPAVVPPARPHPVPGPARTPPPEWDAEGRWNPWAALRARPHVVLRIDPEAALLGGAMLVQGAGITVVVLDPALDRRSRRVALAHELVHEERGGGCDGADLPLALDVIVARDEAEVVREVARRLVPPTALRHLLEQRHELGLHVEPWEVAEAFDVDDPTARVALAALARSDP